MRKFISWRRVSTQKQGHSKLGLEDQEDMIRYFVEREGGELIADFVEVYTGTDLAGCVALREAMDMCARDKATLIIAKTDRFRNTMEALQVYEEMGEGNIYFCDLPHSDKFTLTLFFSLAEREALLDSIRTRQALKAKKRRGESTGGTNDLWGKKVGKTKDDRLKDITKASSIAAARRTEKAKNNPHNKAFWEFIEDYQAIFGEITANTDFAPIVEKLNARGKLTASGLPFNSARAKAMFWKVKALYN